MSHELSELTRLLNRLGSRTVDVLFLSHFHEDHVNGLPLLQDFGIRFKRIVIPLIEPAERLITFVNHPHPGSAALELAINPVNYLADFADVVVEVSNPAPNAEMSGEGALGSESGGRVAISHGTAGHSSLTMGESVVWILKPFVPASVNNSSVIAIFKSELATAWALSTADLDGTLSDASLLRRRITTQKDRRAIRSCYRSALRLAGLGADLNLTTLTLYAGPVDHALRTWRSRWLNRFIDPRVLDLRLPNHSDSQPREEVGAWGRPAGWLHTGDAMLNTSSSVMELFTFYRDESNLVGNFLVPHHGSDRSWCADLGLRLNPKMTCVVSSQPGYRGWNHPGQAVLAGLTSIGCHIVLVTAAPGSRYVDSLTLGI